MSHISMYLILISLTLLVIHDKFVLFGTHCCTNMMTSTKFYTVISYPVELSTGHPVSTTMGTKQYKLIMYY